VRLGKRPGFFLDSDPSNRWQPELVDIDAQASFTPETHLFSSATGAPGVRFSSWRFDNSGPRNLPKRAWPADAESPLTPDTAPPPLVVGEAWWGLAQSLTAARPLWPVWNSALRAGESSADRSLMAAGNQQAFSHPRGCIEPDGWPGADLLGPAPHEAVKADWYLSPGSFSSSPDLKCLRRTCRYVAGCRLCPRELLGSGAGSLLRRHGLEAFADSSGQPALRGHESRSWPSAAPWISTDPAVCFSMNHTG